MKEAFIDFYGEHMGHAVWLLLAYSGVVTAMAVDLVSGIRKARKMGIARTSAGYKMTCDKAVKYFLPMLCLTVIDLLTSMLVPVPVFTLAMAAWNVFCEFRSVMESTHQKHEIRDAQRTMQVVLKNKDDIINAIAQLLSNSEIKGGKDESK